MFILPNTLLYSILSLVIWRRTLLNSLLNLLQRWSTILNLKPEMPSYILLPFKCLSFLTRTSTSSPSSSTHTFFMFFFPSFVNIFLLTIQNLFLSPWAGIFGRELVRLENMSEKVDTLKLKSVFRAVSSVVINVLTCNTE